MVHELVRRRLRTAPEDRRRDHQTDDRQDPEPRSRHPLGAIALLIHETPPLARDWNPKTVASDEEICLSLSQSRKAEHRFADRDGGAFPPNLQLVRGALPVLLPYPELQTGRQSEHLYQRRLCDQSVNRSSGRDP